MTEACSSLPDYYITLALCRQLNQVNLRQGTQKGIKKSTPQKVYVAILVPKSKLGFEVDLLYYTPKLKKVNAFCKNRQTCGLTSAAQRRNFVFAGKYDGTRSSLMTKYSCEREIYGICKCRKSKSTVGQSAPPNTFFMSATHTKRDAFSSVPFVVLRGRLPPNVVLFVCCCNDFCKR